MKRLAHAEPAVVTHATACIHEQRAAPEEQRAFWPRQIVTETALSRSVMKARRAVDDDAGKQHVIRTLHGHGYRFVAALAEQTEAGGETPAAAKHGTVMTMPCSRSSRTEAAYSPSSSRLIDGQAAFRYTNIE